MAVGIVCLAIFDREFASLVTHGTYQAFVIGTREAFASGWWDGITSLFAMTVLFLMLVVGLIISIYLPFTRRRIWDVYVALIIMAHSIIMCAANFVLLQRDGGAVNAVIAIGSLLWLTGYFWYLRVARVDYLTDRQASRQEAWIAGMAIFCAIAVCSLVLDWHWANCYAFAFISAVTVTHGAKRLNRSESMSGDTNPAGSSLSQTRFRRVQTWSYTRRLSRSIRRNTS